MKKYTEEQNAQLKKWKIIWATSGYVVMLCFMLSIALLNFNYTFKEDGEWKHVEDIPTRICTILWIVDAVVFLISLIVIISCLIYSNKKMKWLKNTKKIKKTK
jgi:magnesium-transporting ATPase (P-type)